jgi:anthranilate phosphoribosyltransferase
VNFHEMIPAPYERGVATISARICLASKLGSLLWNAAREQGARAGTAKFQAHMIEKATNNIAGRARLKRAEAEAVMEEILSGRATDAQIVAFLSAMRAREEAVDELVGFATAMRRHAQPVFADGARPSEMIVDTCGTGGAGRNTFNISTCVAFVVAGAGVRVAKHGNRSFSSRCGSADVLEALGVNVQIAPSRAGAAIVEIGIGFLFAPAVHTAMKHAIAARRQLGGRTVFNLLGPLTNPAGARAQVAGVTSRRLTELLATALVALGTERAFIVHGADGLDEISLSDETYISEARGGEVHNFTVTPEEFGLSPAPLTALAGGDAAANARIIRAILDGESGARRDIVLANSSAALVAAGVAVDFRAGVRLATQSINSRAAKEKLEALITFTRD